MIRKRAIGRYSLLIVASAIVIGQAPIATAAVYQIQLGGVDLSYDGTNVVDGGIVDPDPLTNATFLYDNVLLGAYTTGVTLDLFVPDVFNIPVGGGQVLSAPQGTLYLDLSGGEFLSLTLEEAIISYIPLSSTVHFVFAGSAGSIDGQQLPFGISLIDPVSVSFSTQLMQSVSHDGTYINAFVSSGTGEIQAIPEPATLGLLALGSMGLLKRKRRA